MAFQHSEPFGSGLVADSFAAQLEPPHLPYKTVPPYRAFGKRAREWAVDVAREDRECTAGFVVGLQKSLIGQEYLILLVLDKRIYIIGFSNLERARGCRISEGLAALAKGVGSSVPVLLHNQREDLAKEVPVLDTQDPMDRHTPEGWQAASRTAGNLAEGDGTCFVRAMLHSPSVP